MGKFVINLDKMSVAERLQLLDDVWDSLDGDSAPLTPSQLKELDRRLDQVDAGQLDGNTASEVIATMKGQ